MSYKNPKDCDHYHIAISFDIREKTIEFCALKENKEECREEGKKNCSPHMVEFMEVFDLLSPSLRKNLQAWCVSCGLHKNAAQFVIDYLNRIFREAQKK